MKKILIVIVVLFTLVGCSEKQETQKIVDEDPLIMHVNAKNHVEFFLVKEGTPVEDFHPEELIEVEINKDVPYEVAWVGERYAFQCNTYKDVIDKLKDDAENKIYISKKDTLSYESFRPITIYVIAKDDNGKEKEQRLDITLLVAPEKLYDDLLKETPSTMDKVYKRIIELGETKYGPYTVSESRVEQIAREKGYYSNISADYNY